MFQRSQLLREMIESWKLFERFSLVFSRIRDSPNFGRKEKCRNVIMSKSNKVENKNGTNVEMLDAYKCQHMIVRNFNALTLTRTFSPSLLFLFSTFSFFGIFMFRHFYFRPKLGLPNSLFVLIDKLKKVSYPIRLLKLMYPTNRFSRIFFHILVLFSFD